MSGHSKWATTKRHKAAVDAKRGKIFSVMAKELTMAARQGGGNPEFNARLRTIMNKAKTANMPAENIDRAIKKGTGELPGVSFEQMIYEAYGPGGVGLIIEVTTDNRNRSVSAVRNTVTKAGGKLAVAGALAFNFQRQGQFLIAADKVTEEDLFETVIDAGIEDVVDRGDHYEALCPVAEFDNVSHALEEGGIQADSSELAWMPHNLIPVPESATAKRILRLIEDLEDLEDVQNVFANYDIDDSLVEG